MSAVRLNSSHFLQKEILSANDKIFFVTIIINQQNRGDTNLKQSLVNALSRLGQKCFVIWKVNHPAHLISYEV